ncbi:MAG: metalloregulator ArsR/SmtB family transcription factor [Candidatus Cybelea sp.]
MQILDLRAQHLRFGFSTVRECLRAMEVFLNPSHHAEQMPWVRDARRRVSRSLRRKVEELRFFLEPSVETFAFLWTDSSEHSLESELQVLLSHPARYLDAVVKRLSGARLFTAADMDRIRRPRWYRRAAAEHLRAHSGPPGALKGFLESPSGSLQSFCEVIAEFYDRAIAHSWGSISQRLLDDIVMRRRILREQGVAAMLRTLSPGLVVHGGRQGAVLDVPGGSATLKLTDANVALLTPSFFCWPHIQTFFRKDSGAPRCVITYGLPPLPSRTRRLANPDGLVQVLGALADPLRLRIAELLRERDLSTRELAGFLNQSEPVVSKHLRRLLSCGLLSQERRGYFVMYQLQQAAVKQLAQALSALT